MSDETPVEEIVVAQDAVIVDDEDAPLKDAHGDYVDGPQEEDFNG